MDEIKGRCIADPLVQFPWHGSQRPCLFGYLKMIPSPPITPWGQEEMQCGPSCRLAHSTHSSAPCCKQCWTDNSKDTSERQSETSAGAASRWQQHRSHTVPLQVSLPFWTLHSRWHGLHSPDAVANSRLSLLSDEIFLLNECKKIWDDS